MFGMGRLSASSGLAQIQGMKYSAMTKSVGD